MIRSAPAAAALIALSLLAAPCDGEANGTGEERPPAQERVYLSLDRALAETFPAAVRYERDVRPLPSGSRKNLEQKLGGPVEDDTLVVHQAFDAAGKLLGYGVVSEEIGKYHPMTFLVGTTPELKVVRVSVLVYRESHGGDVRRERFLNQYRGKDVSSPLRLNRDIVNISGATLSVNALNFGVRKVLSILAELYPAAAVRK